MSYFPPWLGGAAMLLLALLFDLAVGELPTVAHPVGWLGRLISLLERLAPRGQRRLEMAYGAAMVALVVVGLTAASWWLMVYLGQVSQIAQVLAGAFLLKSSFSLRELFRAAQRVRRPLADGDLAAARHELRSLVSRDTARLSSPLLAAAAVESVAENSSDSAVAPLLYFAVFGIPGAVAYRAINTFDSMVGYHGKYEYLGKFAARLDDLANWLPARLTALLIVVTCRLAGGDAGHAWRLMARHHARTESPNAGWPMAAMAGALGVQLEKVGYYKLGEARRAVSPDTISQSVRIAWLVSLAGLLLSAVLKVGIDVYRA